MTGHGDWTGHPGNGSPTPWGPPPGPGPPPGGPRGFPGRSEGPPGGPWGPGPEAPPGGPTNMPPGQRRRKVIALVTVVAVLAAAAVAGGSYLLLRTRGSPGQTAAGYLSAWQRGNTAGMRQLSVNVPPGGLAAPIAQVDHDLGVRSRELRLGRVAPGAGGTARAAFTATLTLADGLRWTYQGKLDLLKRSRHWWVNWSPSAIYPLLKPGERFHVSGAWLSRAPILAADGTRLDSPEAVAESGSVEMLTGTVGPATAGQLNRLGPPYQKGDMAGQDGLEKTYERRLAGTPRTSIRLVNGQRHVVATVANFGGKRGTPLRTSIDMGVQQAASHAVAAVSKYNVGMVALRPSTGQVLAVVNKPGGFDRALLGTYPPGSTFKMVTASALALTGMQPSDKVECPATLDIGGRKFHNFDYEKLGTIDLLTAFAVSCNTTFAGLAADRLGGGKLGTMARQFGFGLTPHLGIPAALGRFTAPSDSTELAADGFGQGTDIVNPLEMATIAGAIEDGVWRSPRLAADHSLPAQVSHRLSPVVTSALRPMMGAVVKIGTAAAVGFPPGVYGKTGTAEYGTRRNPPSHAWFAGYRGDLAFAVIVEGGGTGAEQAGPVANAFLRSL